MNKLVELLDNVSIREQWRRIRVGLGCPKDSGEYRYAVYLLKHFFGPSVISVAGSFVILICALTISINQTETSIALPKDTISLVPTDARPPELDPAPPPPPETKPSEIPAEEPTETETAFKPDQPDMNDKFSGPKNPFSDKDADGGTLDGIKNFEQNTFVDNRPIQTASIAVIVGLPGRTDSEREGLYNAAGPGGKGGNKERRSWSQVEGAVVRALWWLKKQQQEDGSWNNVKPAMTGLALLTYLAHGDTPSTKKFGPTVEKGIKWLLSNQESDGRFKGRDPHDYSHPIATYALCEAYGMLKIPEIKAAAEKAIDVIVKGQNASGAWDYNCKPSDRDDLSYTGWCVQALKAAEIAKIENDGIKPAMKKAVLAIKKLANNQGRFGYSSQNDGTGGLTGAGVLSLQMLGAGRQPEALNGIVWLKQATFDWDKPWLGSPIYYWYYVTQVKFHCGGDIWKEWESKFAVTLLKNQKIETKAVTGYDGKSHDIGWWEPPANVKGHTDGPVMDTALCTLQLEVYWWKNLQTYNLKNNTPTEQDLSDPSDVTIQVTSAK